MAVRELVRWVVGFDASQVTAGMKDAKEAAAKLKEETAKVDRSLDSLGRGGQKVASLLGGPFGDLSDIMFDLGETADAAGGAIGGIGATALGAVVGVAALSYAGVQLAASAADAADRLEKAGLAAMIPPESQASVDHYREATEGLRNEVDLLAVKMGGPLLDAVASFSDALTGAAHKAGQLHDTLSGLGSVLPEKPAWVDTLQKVGLGVLTGGSSFVLEGVSMLGERLQETGEQARAVQEWQQAVAESSDEMAHASDMAALALDRSTEASDKLTRSTERRVKATAQAVAATSALVRVSTATVTQVPTVSVISGASVTGTGVGELTSALGGVAPVAGLPTGGSLLGGIAKGLGGAAVSSAAGAGGLGALGALGPVGLGVAAVAGAPALLGTLDGAVGTLTKQFEDLPEALGHALETTLPHLLQALPDLAAAVLEAVVQLPVVLVKALPEILTGLVDTILESIKRILGFGGGERSAREIAGSRALTAIQTNDPNALRDAYEDVVRGASGKDRSRARQGLGRRAEAQRGGMPPIVINGITDPRELARRLRRELGGDYGASYATGDTL